MKIVTSGYCDCEFKMIIQNKEITVGELRGDMSCNRAYLEICFPDNDGSRIVIHERKDELSDDVIERARKIVSKKMYLAAEQILGSLKVLEYE